MARLLPSYGWSKLQEVCKTIVSNDVRVRSRWPYPHWANDILKELEPAATHLQQCVMGDEFDREAYAYNTLRHVIIMAERLGALQGFLRVVHVMRSNRNVHTTADSVSGYNQYLWDIAPRIDVRDSAEDHPKGEFAFRGVLFNPHKYWKVA